MFKNTLKQSVSLSTPLVISDLIRAFAIFVSIAMVARLGKTQLAASGLVLQFYNLVILFGMGPLCIVTVITAQNLGAKNNAGIAIACKQGLITAITIAFPMMFILWLAPMLLAWTKQSPEVIAYAMPFFHTLCWSILPYNLSHVMQQFLCGLGKTKFILFVTVITTLIELFCYYVLLYGKFGLPQCSLSGFSYGLIFTHIIAIIIYCVYLHYSSHTKDYRVFHKWWVIDSKCFREIFRVGLPIGLMWCSRSGFFTVISLMMGALSTATLAAHQIARQFFKLPTAIVYSLAQSAAIKVGIEIGNNDKYKTRLTAMAHIAISFVFILGFIVFYILAPDMAIRIDTGKNALNYNDVIAIALQLFPLVVACLFIDCIRVIFNGALRGLKDGAFQLMIYIIGSWMVAIPMAYILGFICNLDAVGIWWALLLSICVMLICFMKRFLKLTR